MKDAIVIWTSLHVIECVHCGQRFVLFAIVRERELMEQESTYFCPYCGEKVD